MDGGFVVSKILEPREKRAKAWEAAKTFLDSKRDADDHLSAEDAAAYDKMEAEVVDLGKDIERLECAREVETELSATIGKPLVGATSTSATALTLDDVLDLFYALRTPYRTKAIFVANDSTIKAICKPKDSSGQYLWQPSVQDGVPDKIPGKPIHISEYVPDM